MKMIIGLGNPGAQYVTTKHNIGFITVDELAHQIGTRFAKEQFTADIAEFFEAGEKRLLVKPLTYMNDSGRAVGALVNYYQLAVDDILVIYDDLDLPVGTVRLREKGGAGGHNGIKSIIQHLGTNEFKRIRIGIGRPTGGQDVVGHVLSPFPKATHDTMHQAVKEAAEAGQYWLAGHSFTETMNQFNGKSGS